MEDVFSVAYQQTEDELDLEYAFFGIYDGHGGKEAALFAKVCMNYRKEFSKIMFS
jgi:protein phosphatase 1D